MESLWRRRATHRPPRAAARRRRWRATPAGGHACCRASRRVRHPPHLCSPPRPPPLPTPVAVDRMRSVRGAAVPVARAAPVRAPLPSPPDVHAARQGAKCALPALPSRARHPRCCCCCCAPRMHRGGVRVVERSRWGLGPRGVGRSVGSARTRNVRRGGTAATRGQSYQATASSMQRGAYSRQHQAREQRGGASWAGRHAT